MLSVSLTLGLHPLQEPCVMPLEQPWCWDAAGWDQALVPPPELLLPAFASRHYVVAERVGYFAQKLVRVSIC